MKKEQINFRVINGNEISDEIKNTIIKEYTETDKTKTDVVRFASEKFGLSERKCFKILREVPTKPISSVNHRLPAMKMIEMKGGIKLIKALYNERWSSKQIGRYFDVSRDSLYLFIKNNSLVIRDLKIKCDLTDEDIERIKKKYGIK